MNTRSTVIALVVAAGLVAAGAHVFAQQPGPGWGQGYGWGYGMMRGDWGGPGRMMGPMMGCPMMGFSREGRAEAFAEGRLAFLKAELAITDAQSKPWEAYAEATRRNLQSMQGMWPMMQKVFEAATPVERLEAHIVAKEARLSALKEVKPALEDLYAALSDEQKRKADELLTSMGCMM